MEPLNKQERTEAFVKVLALFLLCLILAAIPMYYAFKMHRIVSEDCADLKQQVSDMKEIEKKLLLKTDSAKEIYNQYQKEENTVNRGKALIRYSTVSLEMENLSGTVSAYDPEKSRLYDNVVFSFDNLFISQDTIFSLKNRITALLNPVPDPNSKTEPIPTEPTLNEKFEAVVKDALRKYDNNRRLAGQAVGLKKEKTFSAVVEELGL